ncbi:MAG: hypothetical protein J6A22_00260 [Bacteroidales bacterium]|nr:hypothetical protein [Bacteroidales bacterium]
MKIVSFKDIDWKAIIKAIKETVLSIGRGDILMRMQVHRLFPFILYAFILGWVSIWLSYKTEQAMLAVERNKYTIDTLKIRHAEKTCEIASMNRMSTIEQMLIESGSELMAPEKPADILK